MYILFFFLCCIVYSLSYLYLCLCLCVCVCVCVRGSWGTTRKGLVPRAGGIRGWGLGLVDVSELAGIDHVPTSGFDVAQALICPWRHLLCPSEAFPTGT